MEPDRVAGREQRVHPAFLADGRRRIVLHRPGRAEAARAVGRPHRDVVRQPGERTQRVELLASQAFGRPLAEQIGAADAAGEQRPTGQDCRRGGFTDCRPVMDLPGQVLRGVARRRPGPQQNAADLDLVAVVGAPVIEGVASPGWATTRARSEATSSSAPDR